MRIAQTAGVDRAPDPGEELESFGLKTAEPRRSSAAAEVRETLATINRLAITVWTVDERLALCNDVADSWYTGGRGVFRPGVTLDHAVRQSLAIALGTAAETEVQAALSELRDAHRSGGSVVERRLPSGRWLRRTVHAIPGGGFVSFSEDVTELKAYEAALREHDERLADDVNGNVGGLFDIDLITGHTWLSPGLKALLGFGDDELANAYASFESRVDPADWPGLRTTRGAAEGQATAQGHRDQQWHHDFRVRHRNGTVLWMRAHCVLIYDDTGSPLRVVGTATDMTIRKRLEHRVRVERERTERADRLKRTILAHINNHLRSAFDAPSGFPAMIGMDGLAGCATLMQRDFA